MRTFCQWNFKMANIVPCFTKHNFAGIVPSAVYASVMNSI